MKRNSYISILIGACLWESCQNNQMYFDEPTQCLVSADGYDLRWVCVDNDTQNMSYLIYRKGRHKSTLNLHKIKYGELFYTKMIVLYLNICYIMFMHLIAIMK